MRSVITAAVSRARSTSSGTRLGMIRLPEALTSSAATTECALVEHGHRDGVDGRLVLAEGGREAAPPNAGQLFEQQIDSNDRV